MRATHQDPVKGHPTPRTLEHRLSVLGAALLWLRNHYDVAIASSGEQAVGLITDGAWFDAVVSDVMMPTMTGLDVLDRIAAHAPAQARRFVLLSGGVFSDELRDRLDAAGAPQLDKPIDAAALRAALIEITEETAGAAVARPGTEPTDQPSDEPTAALGARRGRRSS